MLDRNDAVLIIHKEENFEEHYDKPKCAYIRERPPDVSTQSLI